MFFQLIMFNRFFNLCFEYEHRKTSNLYLILVFFVLTIILILNNLFYLLVFLFILDFFQ